LHSNYDLVYLLYVLYSKQNNIDAIEYQTDKLDNQSKKYKRLSRHTVLPKFFNIESFTLGYTREMEDNSARS
jgi:hypothetical protein